MKSQLNIPRSLLCIIYIFHSNVFPLFVEITSGSLLGTTLSNSKFAEKVMFA